MKDANELRRALAQYNNGTGQYHRHGLVRSVIATDGAKFFFENAGHGAYWLFDIMATETKKTVETRSFAKVIVKSNGKNAVVDTEDGNGNVLKTKRIDITDCPEGEWPFFMVNDGDYQVILLPTEY